MEIRPYRITDEDGVVALWELAFPDEPEWNASRELIRQKLTTQPELFFVCVMEAEIIGTVIAGYDGVRGWVHKLAAHPAHRGLGVARRLMATAEQALTALGCEKLNLQVRRGNEGAAAFYARIGYGEEDRISFGKRLRKA